jgi:benzoyl-CoA reductase/2-hydroxyglutaryl-CoA dehydratase subunit BcrC/BadD/HgdB
MKRTLLLIIFPAILVFAQPRGMGPGSEKAMSMIRTMRIVRMTEVLELDENQVAALIPKLKQRDSLELNYYKSQAEDINGLREELDKRSPSEEKLAEILERMKSREAEHHRNLASLRDEMLAVLTVPQQARFVIFEVEFEREIRRLISQVKGGHGPGSQNP